MAASLVGEAAIRIVPTLKGFKERVEAELNGEKFKPVGVKVDPLLEEAKAKLAAFRAEQDTKSIHYRVRADGGQLDRDLKQIEHRVAHSPLHNLFTFNIKVLGLDALPMLAYAAASAASGLDALGESALALPGLLDGVGASVGALAIGMHGLKDVFSQWDTSIKDASQRAHTLAEDNRAVQRSYRDYRDAVRDTTREIQDLNAENRRSSLNVADAELSVQEAADRLRQGNFSTITEMRRAQLSYAESLDRLNEVRTKSNRTQEDTNRVNQQGVEGSDKVQSALERIANSTEKLNQDKVGNLGRAMEKLSPNAQAAMNAIFGLRGAWMDLTHHVQDNLFAGVDKDIENLAHRLLPELDLGFSRVAHGLNTNFHQVFQSLGSDQNKGLLHRIFGDTDGGLENMSKGIDPLVNGLMRLQATSSDFLPRLGTAAAKVFDRFDAWTQKITRDGSLNTWIDQGLKAMDNLGHIATGVIGVIHSVGQAFNDVSGHQGGFLKTFADELTKIEEHLRSPQGIGKLESYLRGAKTQFDAMRGAWHEMKPTVEEIVGIVRDWSVGTMNAVGQIAQFASWVDRTTHLLGPMVTYLMYLRTFKMAADLGKGLVNILQAPARGMENLRNAKTWWDKLGTAQAEAGKKAEGTKAASDQLTTANQKLTAAAAESTAALSRLGREAETTGTKMDTASIRAKAMVNNVANFTSPARTAADAAGPLGSNAERAGGQMSVLSANSKTAHDDLDRLKTKAGEAGESVGGKGASLLEKGKALGSMLGPGAAFQIAIVGATWAIEQLGDAHRKAAEQATKQKEALDGLKGSLDQVTGAVTQETLDQTAKAAQSYEIPGLGKRNILEDAQRVGMDPHQVLQAADPTQQGMRTDMLGKLDAQTKSKIESSDYWKKYGHIWMDNGVDLDTITLASSGDGNALNKVHEAEGKMFGAQRDQLGSSPGFEAARIAGGFAAPSLTEMDKSIGTPDSQTTAIWLRDQSNSFLNQGKGIQQSTTAARGRRRLSAAGQSAFPFGGVEVWPNADGGAIVQFNGPLPSEDWGKGVESSGNGTFNGMISPNRFQVTLSKEAAMRDTEGFAQGGLVGGKGGPTEDANLVKVSRGEHISRARAVDYYGVDFYNKLNNLQIPKSLGHFDGGGWPGEGILNNITGGVKKGWHATENFFTGTLGMSPWSNSGQLPVDHPNGGPAPATPTPAPPPPGPGGGPQVVSAPQAPRQLHTYTPPAPSAPAAPSGPITPQGHVGSDGSFIADPGKPGQTGYYYYGKWITGADGKGPDGKPAAGAASVPAPGPGGGTPGMPGVPGTSGGTTPTPGTAPVPASSYSEGATTPGGATTPVPGMPVYNYAPQPGGGMAITPSGPVMDQMTGLISSMLGTPYISGGNSLAGTDCSGLASMLANIASGRPALSGRFATPTEGAELAQRGFKMGKGPPGTLRIGWNGGHTAITLPDGRTVSSGEDGGVKWGGGGADESQFTNQAYLPVDGSSLGGAGMGGAGGMYPGGVPGMMVPGSPEDPTGAGPSNPMEMMKWKWQQLLNPQNISANVQAHYAEALSPKNVFDMLGSQGRLAGSAMLGIGTNFLSGITGLNLSSILGPGEEIGNWVLQMAQPTGKGTPGVTGLNSAAGSAIADYTKGSPGLSPTAQSNLTGITGTSGDVASQVKNYIRQKGASLGLTPTEIGMISAVEKVEGTGPNGMPSMGFGPEAKGAGYNFDQNPMGAVDQFYKQFIDRRSKEGDPNNPQDVANYIWHTVHNASDPQYATKLLSAFGAGAYADGGSPDEGHAWLSKGEFRSGPQATKYYGPALFNALNSMSLPKNIVGKFADGDWPIGPPMPAPGVGAGRGPQPGPPQPIAPPVNPTSLAGPGPQQPGAPGGVGRPPIPESALAPDSRPGPQPDLPPGPTAPGPGAEPNGPGAPKDALPGPNGVVSSIGDALKDNRGAVGAIGPAPKTLDHLNPAISGMASGVAQGLGNVAGMAGSMFGPAGGAAAGMAGGAAQVGAQAFSSALNIFASLMTPNTGPAGGTPVLPQRQPAMMSAPTQQRIHNGDVHVTNLDEYKRTQETMDAQQSMPFLGKYW